MLSVYVLFWPSSGGPPVFPQADKVVHAALFALLAGTAGLRLGARTAVLLAVVAYAPVSELVQAFALPTRSGDPVDVVADLVGTAAGWAWVLRRRGARTGS